MKVFLISALLISTTTFAKRGEISSSDITAKEAKSLSGIYTNPEGFTITVNVEKPSGQLDLFRTKNYDVDIELSEMGSRRYVYFSEGTPYVTVNPDDSIEMSLRDDDCDNPGCENTYTDMTFKKKRNGTYSLVVEVQIEQNIDPGDGYEEDEITDEICEEYLSTSAWVRNIGYEGYGLCTAEAVYFMKKR